MSPEQVVGDRTVDHRSDLWALGVVAFECMTGRLPFVAEAFGDLLVQIVTERMPVPSELGLDLPGGFDAWFEKAVARDPAARFQNPAELADALTDALLTAHEPSSEKRPAAPEYTRPPRTRTPVRGISTGASMRSAWLGIRHSPARRVRTAALMIATSMGVLGLVRTLGEVGTAHADQGVQLGSTSSPGQQVEVRPLRDARDSPDVPDSVNQPSGAEQQHHSIFVSSARWPAPAWSAPVPAPREEPAAKPPESPRIEKSPDANAPSRDPVDFGI
jgi:serine/threonine-protein kinase